MANIVLQVTNGALSGISDLVLAFAGNTINAQGNITRFDSGRPMKVINSVTFVITGDGR